VYVALQGAGEGRKTAIPLTPALALGAAVVVLAG
jgi:prepilin signal peptidase PulO-like enzyme (type II secretory pathway)